MKCEVTSNTTHRVLISKENGWKSYKEVCSEEPRKVNLAYNNLDLILKVENNTLLQRPDAYYPYPPPTDTVLEYIWEKYFALTFEWELLEMFFAIHNIEPNWLNGNGTWISKDEETGIYDPSGIMGKV